MAQLLFLEADNPKKEVSMYINSPGGVVTSGLAIYDTMQFVRPAVATLCIGQAASMGSLLLTAGEKDMRFALPNARIMLHQPSGGFQGQATDIMLHAQEILNLKKRLNEIYVRHTGQTLKKIEDALERDMFLTADMAKEFGIIDKVIDRASGRSRQSPDYSGARLQRRISGWSDLCLSQLDRLRITGCYRARRATGKRVTAWGCANHLGFLLLMET